MNTQEFYSLITQQFPFTPTPKQEVLLRQLSNFIIEGTTNEVYVLKGYAGTGKTTIISTLVSNLWKIKKRAVLMAPTGRAAKVASNYSNEEAFTSHNRIYFPKKNKSGAISFVLQPNKHKDTLFIVDEASMIPDIPGESKLFENGSLLDDLMQYVYSGHRCKLLLIGDTAQLPPVKLELSPALDVDKLSLNYSKNVTQIELDQVVRQTQDSGILSNATQLRLQIKQEQTHSFRFTLDSFQDIVRLTDGEEIMSAIHDAYSSLGNEETAIIVRSNKRANLYNQSIRERILFNENELTAGDYLMVVKNNYFWIKPTSEAGFIANGDIVQVHEIFKIEILYGF